MRPLRDFRTSCGVYAARRLASATLSVNDFVAPRLCDRTIRWKAANADTQGWLDTSGKDSGRVRAVRVILAGGSQCNQAPVGIQFRDKQ